MSPSATKRFPIVFIYQFSPKTAKKVWPQSTIPSLQGLAVAGGVLLSRSFNFIGLDAVTKIPMHVELDKLIDFDRE